MQSGFNLSQCLSSPGGVDHFDQIANFAFFGFLVFRLCLCAILSHYLEFASCYNGRRQSNFLLSLRSSHRTQAQKI